MCSERHALPAAGKFLGAEVSGSHRGPTGVPLGQRQPFCTAAKQAFYGLGGGGLQEPNSTVNESLVPEPFKTRCFLVLRRCQQRPVLLETKRKPCLHISPVSSGSFGRKTALLSSHQIHPTVACPFWWCQHFKLSSPPAQEPSRRRRVIFQPLPLP